MQTSIKVLKKPALYVYYVSVRRDLPRIHFMCHLLLCQRTIEKSLSLPFL